MAISAAGSLIGGLGSQASASASAGYNSQAAMQNAWMSWQNAQMARQDAQNRALHARQQAARLASTQKASYGATGISADSQSALEVLAHTDAQGEIAAMEALYGGEREAANYLMQGMQSAGQASYYKSKSQDNSNLIAGILGAGQAFLPLLQKLG